MAGQKVGNKMRSTKRIIISLLVIVFSASLLFGCSESGNSQTPDELGKEESSIDEPYKDEPSMDELSNSNANPKKELDILEGVWIETEYETYKVGVTKVRVKWFNQLRDSVMFGEFFILEENVNGEWKQVSKKTNINYAFNSLGYSLPSNDTRWHTFNLIPYTDGLPSGTYRISTTFLRETLDGKDYGAGNYPEYQVYGYFNVGDNIARRNMSILDDTKIEYLNEEYHFAIYLPKDWEGLQVIKAEQTGDKEWDELFSKIDKEYVVINLRHPQWTKEMPFQDISLVIFRSEQWNKNLNDATDGNYDILPQEVPGGDISYVIRLNPTAYKDTLKGYKDVLEIIGDNYFTSSVRNY